MTWHSGCYPSGVPSKHDHTMGDNVKKSPLRVIVSGLALACAASAQITSVFNAASLSSDAVAPGSIITVKGTRLASANAMLNDARTVPYTLGGTTLTIGGFPAGLFYVSPTQVNARIDPRAAIGMATVVLTSTTGTYNATVNVAAAAPGLFSLKGSGVGDGAIIHALTYSISAFSPRTGSGPTFLSLYGTGLNLATPTIVRIGGVPVPVLFAGDVLPAGLQQINVQLLDSLAGAGRVSVVVESGGKLSNAVEIVLLPNAGQTVFPSDQENETRSREISDLAWVPGTSLVLVTDENDDVVRVADVKAKSIVRTIVLASGANPVAVAVNAAGTRAVVCERDLAKVAILDLTANTVMGEVAVGHGPVAAAITGNTVVVANQEDDTVSIFTLGSSAAAVTVPVQHAPRGVAADAAGLRAYVTNQDSATISVIELTTRIVADRITLPAAARPQAIQIAPVSATQNALVVTDPTAGPDGRLYMVDPVTKQVVQVNANPAHTGGATDIAIFGNAVYVANQAAGTVTFGPVSFYPTFVPSTIQVGMGVRALTVDAKDLILVTANQGSGSLTLVDLTGNKIIGQIDAVRPPNAGDDEDDDRSDREKGVNMPVVSSLAPAAGKAGTTFPIVVNGSGFSGASDVIFVDPASIPGKGHGHGNGNDDFHNNGKFGSRDEGISVSGIVVNAAGTQLTALVKIAAGHEAATRTVRVLTHNGESSFVPASGNTFKVNP